jgi:hypothetical protein
MLGKEYLAIGTAAKKANEGEVAELDDEVAEGVEDFGERGGGRFHFVIDRITMGGDGYSAGIIFGKKR